MSDPSPADARHLPLYEGPDELKLRTWVQLVRTFYRVHRRLVSSLAGQDITLPQFDVLATLRFGEGLTQQELAERLLVSKGNVCGVIDRLEALNFVQRRPDPHDRRANRLYLTAQGRHKIESVLPDHDQLILSVMRPLDAADARTLRGLLQELESGMGED